MAVIIEDLLNNAAEWDQTHFLVSLEELLVPVSGPVGPDGVVVGVNVKSNFSIIVYIRFLFKYFVSRIFWCDVIRSGVKNLSVMYRVIYSRVG